MSNEIHTNDQNDFEIMIKVEKLSKILKRNDIKKSEAYQSGYLQGTAPVYESYINFKNAIISLENNKCVD